MTPSSSSSRASVVPSRAMPRRPKPGLAALAQHRVGGPGPVWRPAPLTSSSGKWTSPMPRSARGSTAHRSASARVRASRPRPPSVSPARARDLLGDLRHLLAALEARLGVGAVDVAAVEGDQPAGGVEDVGGGRVGAVGVADDVGEHGGGARPRWRSPRARAARPASPCARWDTTSTSTASAPEHVAPAVEVAAGDVGPAGGEGPAELGAGAEQDGEGAGLGGGPGVLGDEVEAVTGVPRSPARWVADTSRHSAAQPRPSRASSTTRRQRQAARAAVEERPAAGRVWRAGAGPGRAGPVRRRGPGGTGRSSGATARSTPNTGRTPARRAGLRELDGAVHAVAVGEGQGVHAVLGGPLDEGARVGGAVAQRVAGGHVQVDEGVGHGRRSRSAGGRAGRAGSGRAAGVQRAGSGGERAQPEASSGWWDSPSAVSTTARKASASRSRSSASRAVTRGQPGLGGGPLAGAGGEERGPLPQLGGDPGQQHPGAGRPGAAGGRGPGPAGEHRGGGPQRGEVGLGVALGGVLLGRAGLEQPAPGQPEQDGGGQRRGADRGTGGAAGWRGAEARRVEGGHS